MTIETEIAALTVSTTDLLTAVNISKSTLDGKVALATTQANTATAQAVASAASAASALGIYGDTTAVSNAVALSGTRATTATTQATNAATSAATAATQASAATAAAIGASAIVLGSATLLPAMKPALNLDFANSKALDSRITFARASTATRTNKLGLIETVAVNAPRFNYDPITLACKGLLVEETRTNLVLNSEQFSAGWGRTAANVSMYVDVATAPDGTLSAGKLAVATTANVAHSIGQSATLTVSAAMTLSLYAKAAESQLLRLLVRNSAATGNYILGDFDLNTGVGSFSNVGAGSGSTGYATPVGNGWYRLVLTGVPDTSGTVASITIFTIPSIGSSSSSYAGNVGDGLYIWGAQLEASASATSYIPSPPTFTGRACTATYMNSVGQIALASIDSARYSYNPTNLLIAPKLLTENTATNSVLNATIDGATLVGQDVTVAAVQMTLSFYGTGTVTLSGAYAGTLVGTGAYPVRSTLLFTPAAGTLTMAVTGMVSFCNLETGYGATSFIPTGATPVTRLGDVVTTSQTTRSADYASMTGVNFSSWYNQAEGAFTCEFEQSQVTTDPLARVIFGVGNSGGSSANTIYVVRPASGSTANVSAAVGGVSQISIASGSLTLGSPSKIGIAYKENDSSASLNGAAAIADTDCLVPPISLLAIGTAPWTIGNILNGHIRNLSYYQKRITNTELQALTA